MFYVSEHKLIRLIYILDEAIRTLDRKDVLNKQTRPTTTTELPTSSFENDNIRYCSSIAQISVHPGHNLFFILLILLLLLVLLYE